MPRFWKNANRSMKMHSMLSYFVIEALTACLYITMAQSPDGSMSLMRRQHAILKLRPRNPDGMKFCGECGTLLKNLCPQCESENPQATSKDCAAQNPQHVSCSTQHTTRCPRFTTSSLKVLIRQTSKMRGRCWQSLEIPEDRYRARGSQEGERNNETQH